MKNGVMNSTMKPTPIIHTCTAIVLSSIFKTIPTIARTAQGSAQRIGAFDAPFPKTESPSLLFHTGRKNKLQIRGVLLTSTQRGVLSPQQPPNPPYFHHKNTTLKTPLFPEPPSKSTAKPPLGALSPSQKTNRKNGDIK
jgi:hypothetical protein